MKRLFTHALVVCLSIMTLASCGGGFNVESLVPENSLMAVKCNFEDIYNKSLGDGSAASNAILDELTKELAYMELPADIEAHILKALENPVKAFGLDLTQPVVFSLTSNMKATEANAYVAAAVSDYAAAKNFVNSLYALAVEDYEDRKRGGAPEKSVIAENVDFYYFGKPCDDVFACALSEQYVLLYFTSESDKRNGAKAQLDIEALIKQEKPCSASGFKEFAAASNSVDFWVNAESAVSLAATASKDISLSMVKPFAKDLALNAYLEFEKGKTTLGASIICSDELKELYEQYYAVPSAKYLELLPTKTAFVYNAAMNVEGLKETWNELKSNIMYGSYITTLEAMGIDEEFIGGLPGTITLGAEVLDPDKLGNAIIAIECEENCYNTLVALIEAYGLIERDYNGYRVLDIAYVTYNKDKEAALVMTPELWEDSNSGTSFNSDFSSSALASEVKNGGVGIDFTNMSEDVLDELAEEFGRRYKADDLLEFVTSIVLTYDKNEVKYVWNMGDQQNTILQKLIQITSDNI